jgi:hypothetical protein
MIRRLRVKVLAVFAVSVGEIASAAACPTVVSDWITLGSGACATPGDGTISNFRLNVTTTGTPTALGRPVLLQNTVDFNIFYSNRLDINLANPVPDSSSLTVNCAYRISGPPGMLVNAGQQLGTVNGNSTPLTGPLTGQVCAGGSFSTFPPGSCSGTLVALAPPTVTSGSVPSVPFTFLTRPVSADVFATFTVGPHASFVDVLQSINFFDPSSVPQIPATPASPAVLLTLVGLGIIGAYSILQRRAARAKESQSPDLV